MKKLLVCVLIIALSLSLGVAALANPGQNPNFNPGAEIMTVNTSIGPVVVEVTGGGNNLVMEVTWPGDSVTIGRGNGFDVVRAGNGTFVQPVTIAVDGVVYYTIAIRVQGNSLVGVNTAVDGGFDDVFTAFCRYYAYVAIWNTIRNTLCPAATAGGPPCANPSCDVCGFLAGAAGSDHWIALGRPTDPNDRHLHFQLNSTALYNYWADRLEVGLLDFLTPAQLAEIVEVNRSLATWNPATGVFTSNGAMVNQIVIAALTA